MKSASVCGIPTLFILAAIACVPLMGQESGVPVIVDGNEVARVYAAVGPFTAEERVPAIEDRIVALAKKEYSGNVVTRDIPAEDSTAVVAGSVIIMAVSDLDAEAAGASRAALALQYAASIQKAIAGYRVRHTWLSFLVALLQSLAAWALFWLLTWSLLRMTRWLPGALEGWLRSRAEARDIHGFDLVIWERSIAILLIVVKAGVGIFLLCAFSFVTSYSLGLFPQTAGISTTLLDQIKSLLGLVGLAIVSYLPSGVIVVVVAVLVYYFLKVLKFLMSAVERGDLPVKGMHPEMAKPTFQLARLVVVLFGLVVVFPYLPGGKSDAFKGVSIFLGLLLSLGSSSAVSNVLAGLVLTYMRPYHAGDRVKINDTVGDVTEKTLLVTSLNTIKNIEVVIPNGAILSNQILNYSALARSEGLILHTTVTIGYDAPWRQVHELLIRSALATSGILSSPPPFVLQTALNDFNVSYELNAYTDRPNAFQNIYSHLHEAIQDSFNQAGVEIMSPSFYALRDGNTVTIPKDQRPDDYVPPSFRVFNAQGQADNNSRDASLHASAPTGS